MFLYIEKHHCELFQSFEKTTNVAAYVTKGIADLRSETQENIKKRGFYVVCDKLTLLCTELLINT